MKKKDVFCYPAVFSYEKGKEIAVFFPDLDVATSGVNDVDALESARDCLGLTLFGLEEDGIAFPKASVLNKLKCDKNEHAVLIDVYMPSIRLANINKSVNRTVTLPAWLDAKASGLKINFSRVLQDALKELI